MAGRVRHFDGRQIDGMRTNRRLEPDLGLDGAVICVNGILLLLIDRITTVKNTGRLRWQGEKSLNGSSSKMAETIRLSHVDVCLRYS